VEDLRNADNPALRCQCEF